MVLICFDLDNTLVHADDMHVKAFNKSFVKNNLPKVKSSELKKLFGRIGVVIIKTLFPEITLNLAKKIVHDHNRLIVKGMAKEAKPIKGVKTVLRKLKKQGYKLALLSNCSHIEIDAILKAVKIDKSLFNIIIGSNDVTKPKPWPDEILKAKRLLNAKTVYMVGDTIYDIEAGKKANAKTVAVLTGTHSINMLKKSKPDYILKSAADLSKIIC